MAGSAGFVGPDIKINGVALPFGWIDKVRAVKVDRSLNLVGRATLRFDDADYTILQSGKLPMGAVVEVSAPAGSESSRPGYQGGELLMHGEITGLAIDQGATDAVELTVTVEEVTHQLRRGSAQETYQQMSTVDIAAKVAHTGGLRTRISAPSGESYPYVLQSGSNLAFLDDLARRASLQWRMERECLVLEEVGAGASKPSTVTLAIGEDGPTTATQLQHFSLRATALESEEVEITGWDPKTKKPLVGKAPAVQPFAEAKATTAFGSRPAGRLLVGSLGTVSATEAETHAKAIQADATGSAVTARGTTTALDGRIELGRRVTLKQVGPAEGDYIVSSVQHVYDGRGFRTTFTAGSHRPAGLVDLLHRPTHDSGFTRHDLVVGVVTANNDTDKLGRVKVKWVTTSGQKIETPWARVASPDAGAGRGIVFLPEVDDEVLLGFENGDTRRPVVLGSLFGGKVKLPTKDQDNISTAGVTHRRITSRTGHIIDLDDATSQILVVHKDGHQVLIGKDTLEVSTKQKPIVLTNGQAKIELAANGDITLEGTNITLKGKVKVAVEATTIEAKAQGPVEVSGAVATVKASGMATVQASGVLTLKGAQVMVN